MSKMTINTEIQGDFFQKMGDADQDSIKDLLKILFRGVQQTYSLRVLEEAFQEFQFQLEIEREAEREASMEIEEENDF